MQVNRQDFRNSKSYNPSKDVAHPLLQLTDQAVRHAAYPFSSTMSSISSLVFSLIQDLNCSWISISIPGKGSGFINSFYSLNILTQNKVFSGKHRIRSITRMGRYACYSVLFIPPPTSLMSIYFLSPIFLSDTTPLSFSTLWIFIFLSSKTKHILLVTY